jgi:hypothetical protein
MRIRNKVSKSGWNGKKTLSPEEKDVLLIKSVAQAPIEKERTRSWEKEAPASSPPRGDSGGNPRDRHLQGSSQWDRGIANLACEKIIFDCLSNTQGRPFIPDA